MVSYLLADSLFCLNDLEQPHHGRAKHRSQTKIIFFSRLAANRRQNPNDSKIKVVGSLPKDIDKQNLDP